MLTNEDCKCTCVQCACVLEGEKHKCDSICVAAPLRSSKSSAATSLQSWGLGGSLTSWQYDDNHLLSSAPFYISQLLNLKSIQPAQNWMIFSEIQ